jgi:hypothetical protein
MTEPKQTEEFSLEEDDLFEDFEVVGMEVIVCVF